MVVVNQAFAVAVEALHIAFQVAFEREGVVELHRAFVVFGVVAQGAGQGVFVVKLVGEAQIAVAHVAHDVGVVVFIGAGV